MFFGLLIVLWLMKRKFVFLELGVMAAASGRGSAKERKQTNFLWFMSNELRSKRRESEMDSRSGKARNKRFIFYLRPSAKRRNGTVRTGALCAASRMARRSTPINSQFLQLLKKWSWWLRSELLLLSLIKQWKESNSINQPFFNWLIDWSCSFLSSNQLLVMSRRLL